MNNFLTLFIVFSFLSMVSAQVPEWDEIPESDLKMTSFDLDPDANAIILFDIESMQITKDFDLIIKRHKRIKVFSEEGKKYADISFFFWENDKLLDIEAHAYSPDGEETEFDDDLIQIQEMDEWNRCYFVVPGVQAGSVIEFQYELYRKNIAYLRPWYFQSQIYTVLSQLSVVLQPGFSYDTFSENLDLYDEEFETEEFYDLDSRRNNKRFIWRVRNIPAFVSEKFMFNDDDYYAKIFFQWKSYKSPYQEVTFIKTWEDLSKRVQESLKECIEMDNGLESFTKNLIKDCPEKDEQIAEIFRFVKDSIETRDEYDIWAFKNPDEVLEKRVGYPSCKNLMFLNMLTHAGIEAYPVLISTRSHGKLMLQAPNLAQFNHLLVQVVTESGTEFIDCSDAVCPREILTVNCNVPHGLLVRNDVGKMINIDTKEIKNRTQIKTSIDIDDENELRIKSVFTVQGYPAINDAEKFNKIELTDFAKQKIDGTFEDFVIDTVWIEDQSDPTNLEYHIEYRASNFLEDAGNIAYMSLPILTKMKSNPLVREKRNYPVDFDYVYEEMETVKINLPENIQISEIPLRVRDNSRNITFSSFCIKGSNGIEINRQLRIKKSSFRPSEYSELRRVFDVMTNTDQNQIVFTKL